MATLERPTFTEILTRVQSDIDSRLEGADSHLRRSVLNTLSYIEAGTAHGLYGFIAFLARQIFPDSAEGEYLNRWGVIWGVERRQAVSAKGAVTFTGDDGTVIPAGAELQRSDLTLFTTDATVTIASGVAVAQVTAEVAGEAGNTAQGSIFAFVSPIANIDSQALVNTGGLVGGVDVEDDDSYLERLLERIQQPPQGGSAQDYVIWAKEIPGVTDVWVRPLEDGPGTVTVYFMMYDAYPDGVPESGDVATVQAHIEEVKPVTAIVTVRAPIGVELDFTVDLTLNPGYVEADVEDAVEASLKDMLRRDAEPGGTINLSRITEAINLTEGVYSSIVTVPSGNVTVDDNEISTMGTVTWV